LSKLKTAITVPTTTVLAKKDDAPAAPQEKAHETVSFSGTDYRDALAIFARTQPIRDRAYDAYHQRVLNAWRS
jgi:hypothetical protein